VFSLQNPTPETRNPVSETRNPKSKPDIRNPKSVDGRSPVLALLVVAVDGSLPQVSSDPPVDPFVRVALPEGETRSDFIYEIALFEIFR